MQIPAPLPDQVDVESLMNRLRGGVGEGGEHGLFSGNGSGRNARYETILTQLTEVERTAAVGTVIPRFERFGPLKRRAARGVARVVLYLARLVSVPQQHVNFGLLQALRTTLSCLKEEEAARLELQARVQLLERSLASLRRQQDHSLPPAGADHAEPTSRRLRPFTIPHR